ncbi:hypothetical protein [Poseidonocella sp. HB161398]|uniref:DsrE family protein n=1 Tax=Poseidonocella sp. HB161398 TaxID=2320855 RepID=UPI00110917DD|nr:hypothetical protein [Poseidonocella sp. HB161398]
MPLLHVLIHAPTEGALARARSNARNLMKARPEAIVEIVANAGAVAPAIALADPGTDPYLRLCGNSLAGQGLEAPAHLSVIPAAVVHLAERQAEGWAYIRA